jgi:hypothetical protein
MDRGRLPLEHFHLLCSVLGAKKEAFAVGAGNGLILSRIHWDTSYPIEPGDLGDAVRVVF